MKIRHLKETPAQELARQQRQIDQIVGDVKTLTTKRLNLLLATPEVQRAPDTANRIREELKTRAVRRG